MCKDIIFDLDGTLWDARDCACDIWNRVFDKHEEVEYLQENGAVLFPDLKDTVSRLAKEHNLYIVSNCQDGYVPAFLKAHDMGSYFNLFGRLA